MSESSLAEPQARVMLPSEAQIKTMSAAEARALLADLRSLTIAAPLSASIRATVEALSQAAEDRAAQAENEEFKENHEKALAASVAPAPHPLSSPLERALAAHLSQEERRYLESINPNQSYDVLIVDDEGRVTGKRSVSGETLRSDVAHILKESLPREERSSLPAGSEGSRSEQLAQLQTSLDNVEGQKAAEITQAEKTGKISSRASEEKISDNHRRFKEARKAAQEAAAAHGREEMEKLKAQTAPLNPMGQIMTKAAEKETEAAEENMRKSLQDVREVVPEAGDAPRKEQSRGQAHAAATVEASRRSGHGLPEDVRKAASRQISMSP